MIVVLLGPPGVGKGTQAKLAAEANGWMHLSTGDLLRDEVARGTELGAKADGFMSAGELVPDELMVAMVAGRLAAVAADEVLLLDGFPRTVAQAEALASQAPGGSIRLSLYFQAPDSVLTSRMLGRGRADDTREVVENRLRVYRETTEPLVALYREQGILREIDADRSVEAIQEDALEAVRTVLTNSVQDPSKA